MDVNISIPRVALAGIRNKIIIEVYESYDIILPFICYLSSWSTCSLYCIKLSDQLQSVFKDQLLWHQPTDIYRTSNISNWWTSKVEFFFSKLNNVTEISLTTVTAATPYTQQWVMFVVTFTVRVLTMKFTFFNVLKCILSRLLPSFCFILLVAFSFQLFLNETKTLALALYKI